MRFRRAYSPYNGLPPNARSLRIRGQKRGTFFIRYNMRRLRANRRHAFGGQVIGMEHGDQISFCFRCHRIMPVHTDQT